MPKFVYMVEFDWSTEEDADKEIQLYGNYADAVKRFKEIIANELNPEMSWIGDTVFREMAVLTTALRSLAARKQTAKAISGGTLHERTTAISALSLTLKR